MAFFWIAVPFFSGFLFSGSFLDGVNAGNLPELAGKLEEPLIGGFGNKCIEDLGCFHNGSPFFHAVFRPISMLPVSKFKTKFLLYTPSSPKYPQLLDLTPESVDNSGFVVGLPLKILIHGYSVKLTDNDIRFVQKDELMKAGSYNVIIVDWTEHNQFPYPQAVANARVVGAQVAKLIRLLMKQKGLSPKDIHLIGHSLGSQVCGWTGERIANISRITGLDPAGPYFQQADPVVRLDPSDADFVDVIHTNGADAYIDGLGIQQDIGHMDFYPNGGNHQPGCYMNMNIKDMKNMTQYKDEFEKLVANSCDHSRANQFFAESINNCRFMAMQCKSYVDYASGECENTGPVITEMGYHAKKITDKHHSYFLKTTDKPPYCDTNPPTTSPQKEKTSPLFDIFGVLDLFG